MTRGGAVAVMGWALVLLALAAPAGADEPGAVQPNNDPRNFEGVWWPADGGKAEPGTAARAAQDRSPKPPKMREQEANLPFQPGALAEYRRTLAADLAGHPPVTNLIRCRPDFDLLGNRFSFTAFRQPRQITFLFEEDHAVRRIFLNTRHPAKPVPSYHGHSIGHWERDTLVVDTVDFNDKAGLVLFSPHHSTQMHAVEHIRKSDNGMRLEDRITITDPVLFTKPIELMRYYVLRTDQRTAEFVCEENEREATVESKP